MDTFIFSKSLNFEALKIEMKAIFLARPSSVPAGHGAGIIPVIPWSQGAAADIQTGSGVLVCVADAEVDSHSLGEF